MKEEPAVVVAKKSLDRGKVEEAAKILARIVDGTKCPDPVGGGCVGGPIPGYGCVHEAARAAWRLLREA